MTYFTVSWKKHPPLPQAHHVRTSLWLSLGWWGLNEHKAQPASYAIRLNGSRTQSSTSHAIRLKGWRCQTSRKMPFARCTSKGQCEHQLAWMPVNWHLVHKKDATDCMAIDPVMVDVCIDTSRVLTVLPLGVRRSLVMFLFTLLQTVFIQWQESRQIGHPIQCPMQGGSSWIKIQWRTSSSFDAWLISLSLLPKANCCCNSHNNCMSWMRSQGQCIAKWRQWWWFR